MLKSNKSFSKKEEQKQIDQKIDKVLAQNEEWEETYGHLFEKKGKKKEKFTGGTLASEKKRIEDNKYYVRKKEKPAINIKIKKK